MYSYTWKLKALLSPKIVETIGLKLCLFDNDIHNLLRHNDNLHNLLAIDILKSFLVCENSLLYIFV